MYFWCEPIHQLGQTGTSRSDFMLDSSVDIDGASTRRYNSTKIWGAMAADKLLLFNLVDFTLTGEMKGRPPEGAGPAIRKGWTECRSQPPVTTDPESGC
jgi:hypothetical protein